MGIFDNIKNELGRRNSEARIRRQTENAERTQRREPKEDEDMFGSYGRQAGRLVDRAYQTFTDPQRKAEGKRLLIGGIKHGIGMTARGVLGPRQATTMPKQTIIIKRRKKK